MNVTSLVNMRGYKPLAKISRWLCLLAGADIPVSVVIGEGVEFPHNALGTVIHPDVVIEDRCRIYQNVTLGRQDVEHELEGDARLELVLREGCIICAGAKVFGSAQRPVHIGRNAIVGANAVLTHSIGDDEVWAGIPARFIRMRDGREAGRL